MASSLNDKNDSVENCLNSENFGKLNSNVQTDVLNAIIHREVKSAGVLGKLFGTDEKKAAVYAAILTCTFLIVTWIVLTVVGVFANKDFELKFLESLLMLVAGFLFAKSKN